jgi:hypothetical protein
MAPHGLARQYTEEYIGCKRMRAKREWAPPLCLPHLPGNP